MFVCMHLCIICTYILLYIKNVPDTFIYIHVYIYKYIYKMYVFNHVCTWHACTYIYLSQTIPYILYTTDVFTIFKHV